MTETQIRAIPTIYKGIEFRSRTEARWAVFFDALGVRWLYEEEGFDVWGRWYVPDFHLIDLDAWWEVKGAKPTKDELELTWDFALMMGRPVYLSSGSPLNPVRGGEDLKRINVRGDIAPFPECGVLYGVWATNETVTLPLACYFGAEKDVPEIDGSFIARYFRLDIALAGGWEAHSQKLVNAYQQAAMYRFWDPSERSGRVVSRGGGKRVV